jgi:hypothetical protein
MKALSKIPVIDEAKLRGFLQSFSILTQILGEAGAKRLVDEMDIKARTLDEVNTTFRVVLKKREKNESELEENILSVQHKKEIEVGSQEDESGVIPALYNLNNLRSWPTSPAIH